MLLVFIKCKSDNLDGVNTNKKYLSIDQLKTTCVLLKMKAEKAKQEWPITTNAFKPRQLKLMSVPLKIIKIEMQELFPLQSNTFNSNK